MNKYLDLLGFDFEKSRFELPKKLKQLIYSEFQKECDCIYLSVYVNILPVGLSSDFEKCTFEYDNHFHINDFGKTKNEKDYLKWAIEGGRQLGERLKNTFPEKSFRILISFSETSVREGEVEDYCSCTVRFYEIRPNVDDIFRVKNLELFLSEAVMELEC